MPTLTIYPDKEHSVTNAPGNYGNSKDDHAPVGLNSSTGWRYRDLLRFALNGIPSGAKLVDATLRMKTSGGTHMGMGSGPSVRIRRLTEGFSATGGSGETWQTSADPAGFSTGSTASDEQVYSFGSAENTVRDFSIIGIVEDQAPTNVKRRSGSACGGDNVGIELRAADESNTNDRIEFWSTRGSYKPRLIVEYTMVADPTDPTLIAPLGVQAVAPTILSFLFPSGDTAEVANISVGTYVSGSDLWLINDVPVTPGVQTDVVYAGAALPTGVPIYYTVQGENSIGATSNGEDGTFSITPAPVASLVSPTTGGLLHIHNLGEAAVWTNGGTHAKPRVVAHYEHPGGLSSTDWEVRVGGATVYAFSAVVVPGSNVDLDLPVAWVRAATTTIEVRAKGSGGVWSAWSAAATGVRVNWAQGLYNFAHAGGASAFVARHSALAGGTAAQVAYLYRNSPSGPWKASVADVTPGTSMDVLIRLSTSVAAQVPALPAAKMEWSEAAAVDPDFWVATNADILQDPGFRRLGVHSMRVVPTGAGNVRNTLALVVSPDTEYTFSVFVHTKGATLANPVQLGMLDEAGGELGRSTSVDGSTTSSVGKGSEDWQRLFATFTTPAGVSAVKPCVFFGGTGEFWTDAFQLEEGAVATGWKPGNAGPAVVVDVGGIAVDGGYGGIFRLRAADGSIVELRTDGLYADGTRLPGAGGGGGATDHGALTGLADDDHPQYTTAAEAATAAASAVTTHEAAGNPHSTYATDADLTAHAGAADPHPGYLTPAEGNAAYEASGAVTAHAAAGDPHTGYRLESADHSHGSSGLQAGQVAHSALSGVGATDHHAAPVAGPDANVTVDAAGAAGTASTFARSGHGHQVATTDAPSGANITVDAAATAAATGAIARAAHGHRIDTSSAAAAAIGTASAGTATTAPSRGNHVHPTGAGTPSTQAFGDAASAGSGPAAANTDHKHAMPANPVTAHEAAGNPHSVYATDADLTAHAATSHGGGSSTPPKRTVFGAGSGNWTKTGSPRYIEVEVIGGGGGSGGGASTASGASAVSGGGGGGGYCKAIFDASALGTVAYVAGAAGTAGTAGNNNGGAGGNSSWGSTILTANGGGAGTGAASTTGNSTANGGAGGTAGGTEASKVAIPGGNGGNGESITGIRVYSGTGGASASYGPMQTPGNGAGVAGNGYGGGGGGAANGGSASAVAGGAGAPGAVIVTEYY